MLSQPSTCMRTSIRRRVKRTHCHDGHTLSRTCHSFFPFYYFFLFFLSSFLLPLLFSRIIFCGSSITIQPATHVQTNASNRTNARASTDGKLRTHSASNVSQACRCYGLSSHMATHRILFFTVCNIISLPPPTHFIFPSLSLSQHAAAHVCDGLL